MFFIVCTNNNISFSKLDLMGNIKENYIFKNRCIKENIIYNFNEFYELIKKIKDKIEIQHNDKMVFTLDSSNVTHKIIEKTIKISNKTISNYTIQDSFRIHFDNMKVIHNIPYKYKIDNKIVKNPINMEANELELSFHEFSIDKEIFFNLKNAFKEENINITDFVFDFYSEYLILKKNFNNYSFLSFKDNNIHFIEVKNNTILSFNSIDIGFHSIIEDLKYVLDIKDEKILLNIIKTVGVNFDENYKNIVINNNNKNIDIEVNTISRVIFERLYELLNIINEEFELKWDKDNKNFIFGEDLQKINNLDKTLNHMFPNIFKLIPYQLVRNIKFSEQLYSNINSKKEHILKNVNDKVVKINEDDINIHLEKDKSSHFKIKDNFNFSFKEKLFSFFYKHF